MSISPFLWLAMTIPCKPTRLDPYNILCIKDDSGNAEVLVQHLAPSAWVAETVFGWVGHRRHWKALLESCQHEKVKNHPLRYHRKFWVSAAKPKAYWGIGFFVARKKNKIPCPSYCFRSRATQQDSAPNIAAARPFFARSAMSCFLRDLLTR